MIILQVNVLNAIMWMNLGRFYPILVSVNPEFKGILIGSGSFGDIGL